MKRSDWLRRLRTLGILRRRSVRRVQGPVSSVLPVTFEPLEDRRLLAVDYGDAPDASIGTGFGNYNTLLIDNGPRHTIVSGLRLGSNVDGSDGGVLQSVAAHADDVNGALPDDEDGLVDPIADLTLTVGAQPSVTVRVTNLTGFTATLGRTQTATTIATGTIF